MEKKLQIVSDGSLDLPRELTEKKNIRVVPFYVSFDGETYKKEIDELDIREFYQQMVDAPDVFPKTSMPSVMDYVHVFEEYVKEGIPVLCICITTKFSGSMQSAVSARDMLLEQYPDAKIVVLDSMMNTVLEGIYVLEACRLRDLGLEIDEIAEKMTEIRESGRIFFTVGNIDYLKHGGRIGKVAGLAGGMLKIKPMITMKEGEIFGSGICRNRLKSMQKVMDMLKVYLDERNAKPGEYAFCIGYGYDIPESEQFREMLKELVKERLGIEQIECFQIGATVGVHTGPYPIGVGIVKKCDI